MFLPDFRFSINAPVVLRTGHLRENAFGIIGLGSEEAPAEVNGLDARVTERARIGTSRFYEVRTSDGRRLIVEESFLRRGT